MASELPALFTSRYNNQLAIMTSGLVPVGITLGGVRFKLRYELAARFNQLAPDWKMLKIADPLAFRRAFRARMDALGIDGVAALLNPISEAHQGRAVVLLCFENLAEPVAWCHRRILAEWLEARTGQQVPEL